MSLWQTSGKAMKCGSTNGCMCCEIVSESDHVKGPNGKKIRTAKGQCVSCCLIYHANCILCQKNYEGKTVTELRTRINGHRTKFYDFLNYRGDRIFSILHKIDQFTIALATKLHYLTSFFHYQKILSEVLELFENLKIALKPKNQGQKLKI